ncbi:helix-hairpin-helix domain-containing protein [Methanomicrobium antiquum]|uniref:Helix-hairpin-helix domain-containing protein n=1 Tax=Methanomicrobium antiquum TaxID=487686 RepID=A0AAF0JLI9_9EURY|nr:helix-hairpin-helix domain-containing protein [Methanomicrobium antiquum]WFN36147.1 helix-hairpin-helix domain-containing protein [Methanomicrobium antiquum]
MDLNNASYYELVQIPGIGKKGAGKISRKRKKNKISSVDDLSRLKI